MGFARITGEQFFPAVGRAFPTAELPKSLVDLLRLHKLMCARKRSRRIDLLMALKRIGRWQQNLEKPAFGRNKHGASKRAGPTGPPMLHRSVAGLLQIRFAITDFLMCTFGSKPFIPLSKKGRDFWITLGWAESNFFRSWVSVVDSDNRDVSDWNRRRITNHEGTYTAVLAGDFHRRVRDRAQVIRVWLPALGLAVLYARDGIDPQKKISVKASRNRELACFSLETLWEAMGIG